MSFKYAFVNKEGEYLARVSVASLTFTPVFHFIWVDHVKFATLYTKEIMTSECLLFDNPKARKAAFSNLYTDNIQDKIVKYVQVEEVITRVIWE